ncbi:hypothetical protein ACFVHB_28540 [Kitasatospora sp. NPDC127111]|uniref:hypothetical protein n=1 Tax=Kitasatospora sp. NPDC127111 TaxID=3345363 RepID=UPI00363A686E
MATPSQQAPVVGQDTPSGFDPAREQLKFGVWGDSGDGDGVIGSSGRPGTGVSDGGAGVLGVNPEAQGVGVKGTADADTGTAVLGTSLNGVGVAGYGGGPHPGVQGTGTLGPGVLGASTQGPGVSGSSTQGVGVSGSSGQGTGVAGASVGGSGVAGSSTTGAGISGTSQGGSAVVAHSQTGPGLSATSQSGSAVSASSGSGDGVSAVSAEGVAVVGRSGRFPFFPFHPPFPEPIIFFPPPLRPPPPGVHGISLSGAGVQADGEVGVLASGRPVAGSFTGDVHITGTLTKGGGGFRIDHPLDPENRYLCHSFVESPQRKNVYDGTVTLDAAGRAVVELPDWFDALNTDCHYQLTPLGAPAPELHVAEPVTGNRFTVAGGAAGQRICWQVTGVRQDAWAAAHPVETEEEKTAGQRGLLLHPEERGESRARGIAAFGFPEPNGGPGEV